MTAHRSSGRRRACARPSAVSLPFALLLIAIHPAGLSSQGIEGAVRTAVETTWQPIRAGEAMPSAHGTAVICLACHDDLGGPSHPVGVPAPPSTSLPLDARGRVTCTTCHLLHGDQDTPRLLRGSPQALCAECHGAMAEGHPTQPWMAHLPAGARRVRGGLAGRMDATSVLCLGCHDGPGTGHAPRGLTRQAGAGTLPMRGSHPVGSDYLRLSRERRQLRDPEDLDPRIVLDGGRVGCISCHDPFAPTAGKLVMSNRRSRLCLQCHVL